MNGAPACGALLERLQQEHHELNCKLFDIKSELAALMNNPGTRSTQQEIATNLAGLTAELKMHFADEEQGGCFEEALSRCPSLCDQVQALIAEHPQILLGIDKLRRNIRGKQRSIRQVHDDFDRLARQLHLHEVKESRLLQMALGGDASDYDVEGNE